MIKVVQCIGETGARKNSQEVLLADTGLLS